MAPTTGEQLLQQIWQRPDDRHLLGVYADWLATNGDPIRAEYMQLSLLPKRTKAHEARRELLKKRHSGAWLGAARKFAYTWEASEESPGFIGNVRCSMPKLTAGFEVVRALAPRLVVTIGEPKARRETLALAKLPLGKLYGIAMYENDQQWITDALLATLGPTLGGLRSLAIYAGEARASDRGWMAMLAHLDAVENLELGLGENPEAWLEALLDSKLVRSLKHLSVPHWIGRPLQKRLAAIGCELVLRRENRMRFDRTTGFYM